MKQIIFILMMLVFPAGIIAQVDDLYYVPTKKKVKKEVKATTSSNTIKIDPATNATQNGTNVVRIGQKSNIVNGIDEDAYNRRSTTSTYSTEQEYAEEEVYEEEYIDEPASDADYTYSSRIVRFHSPRRAVVLSSPLYWDVVYNCGLDNWTIYDDGIYWDVYPDYSYSSIYVSPWYSPSWSWYTGCGWGFSFGWGHSSWYWNIGYHHPHWYYPYYPIGGIHHHHGHHIGGWRHSFNGGYREAVYSNRNGGGRTGYVPRATGPSRADAGVRAGTVARNNRSASAQSDRTGRRTNNAQRVYDRPSSTRTNVTRNGVTNERTRNNSNIERTNNSTRVNNNRGTNTRTNNAVRENSNTNVKRNNSSTTRQKEVKTNSNSKRNNRSSYKNNRTENRSNVSRSNNSGSRNNNSRSTIGSQSRGSNFSGGGGRSSGGGSRSSGGRSGGGRR